MFKILSKKPQKALTNIKKIYRLFSWSSTDSYGGLHRKGGEVKAPSMLTRYGSLVEAESESS